MPVGPAQVNLCQSPIFGSYLVDASGMTLYAFSKDTQNSTTSACSGTCASTWPPFLTNGTPTVGSNGTGLQASLLGTITLSDGTTEVTYNGWALHYFSGDKVPGDIKGEVWFVVPPTPMSK